MKNVINDQLKLARQASKLMPHINKETKEKALKNISDALIKHTDMILIENQKDIDQAKINGIKDSLIDRLRLTKESINTMSKDILKVIDLEDPIGSIIREIHRPNGLVIKQIRIPIGVIGIIYESRPNVTVDIASLCIKTNNVCLLKGGKEAIHSNKVLVNIINEAIKDILPENTITLIETLERKDIDYLIKAREYIDVLIPRGSLSLINYVTSNATVPVIETGAGICHLYIDEYADLNKAINIAINAKTQRPSVCNAIETILVHKNIKDIFLPLLNQAFKNIKCFVDEQASQYICGERVCHQNYATEYNDYICNIKVVENIDDAIKHIYKYSTKHSETIISENKENAQYFMDMLDSACVYHNASTRFSDGGEFGFGGEVGISTQKLHARGPLGLQEITSSQYLIYGDGQVRSS